MLDINVWEILQTAIDAAVGPLAKTFLDVGETLFRGLAIIMVVWHGVKAALSAASGTHAAFDFSKICAFILQLSFCWGMIHYYDSLIPGMSYNFPELVTAQTGWVAGKVTGDTQKELYKKLPEYLQQVGMGSPAWNPATLVFGWVVLVLAYAGVIAIHVAMMVVIAFSYVAVATAIALGPLFIPFFIVPWLDWLFWGWFKSLLKYSFYVPVAAIFGAILGRWVITVLDLIFDEQKNVGGGLTPPLAVWLFVVGVIMFYAMTKIPQFTNDLLSGGAGVGTALPDIAAVGAAADRAAAPGAAGATGAAGAAGSSGATAAAASAAVV